MQGVVHFEFPADDPGRASKFYQEIFGWQADAMPEMKYTMLITTEMGEDHKPKQPGAINGGMFQRSADLPVTVVTIDVPDIDQALEDVTQHGGSVVRPKVSIGDNMGSIAYFKDTEGNVVGLWQI